MRQPPGRKGALSGQTPCQSGPRFTRATRRRQKRQSRKGTSNTSRLPQSLTLRISPWPPSLPPSRASWTYNVDSYEAKRMLHLVEESATEYQTTLSETRMTTVPEAEATWNNSHPAQPESAPLSRANSDLSLYTLVRRRSVIQVPGVATRTTSVRTNPATRSSHRYSHPGSPNLSRQGSIESFRSGIISMPPIAIPLATRDLAPRVITPCESEYHAIGAFKLGTLRVVNGPAGPASPESDWLKQNSWARQGQVSQQGGDYFSKTRQPSADDAGELSQVAEEHKPTLADVPSRPDVSDDADERSENKGGPGEVPSILEEVHFTPFVVELSDPLSTGLATTSKHTAYEDMLFEVDDVGPEYTSSEVLDVRLDPSAKAPPPADTGLLASRTMNRADSGFVSATSPLSESFASSLAKADSGYSSNVSVRSFHAKSKEILAPVAQEASSSQDSRASQSGLENGEVESLATTGQMETTKEIGQSLPSQDALTLTHGRAGGSRAELPKLRVMPVPNTRFVNSSVMSPDSIPRTPGSATWTLPNVASSASSIGSQVKKVGKLRRLLSGARRISSSSLTAHSAHISKKPAMPSISQGIEARIQQSTGLFPIATKRPTLKPRSSMGTLKTIPSVESLDVGGVTFHLLQPRPPVPNCQSEKPGDSRLARGLVRRHTLSNASTSAVHAMNPSLPALPGRMPTIKRKPIPSRQNSEEKWEQAAGDAVDHETMVAQEAELTTYDSVATTLGSSAYDAGLKALEGQANTQRAPPSRAPNQAFDLFLPPPRPDLKTTLPLSVQNAKAASLRAPPRLGSQRLGGEMFHGTLVGHQRIISGQPWSVMPPPIPPMSPLRPRSAQTSWPSSGTAHQGPTRPGIRTCQAAQSVSDCVFRSTSSTLSYEWPNPMSPRPESAQRRPAKQAPSLRQRASCDGLCYASRQADHGQRPPSAGGYRSPSKPIYDPWSNPHEVASEHWDQFGRGPAPPHVPRQHYRNRSTGSNQGYQNAPWRVLHSYNTPAYRNAPIW